MTKPVQIRSDEVVRDIRELATLTRKSMTDAVAEAVRIELERARRSASLEERRRGIKALQAEVAALPVLGPPLTDDELYDDYGLPK